MQEHEQPYCPECDDFQETDGPDRRAFLRVAGLGTASLLGLGAVRGLRAEEKGKPPSAPANRPRNSCANCTRP